MPRPIQLGHNLRRRNKYGVSAKAERTVDGITFDSKLEMRVYLRLKREREEGSVLFFLRQVPFHLPGDVIYLLDFLVFRADGTVEFLDPKGKETRDFRIKKKQVEALYPPVEITLIKK